MHLSVLLRREKNHHCLMKTEDLTLPINDYKNPRLLDSSLRTRRCRSCKWIRQAREAFQGKRHITSQMVIFGVSLIPENVAYSAYNIITYTFRIYLASCSQAAKLLLPRAGSRSDSLPFPPPTPSPSPPPPPPPPLPPPPPHGECCNNWDYLFAEKYPKRDEKRHGARTGIFGVAK